MLHGVRVNVGNDEQPAGLFELRTHLHSEAFMGNTQKLIEQAYSAFNNRDIDSAMALMSENVSWPKAVVFLSFWHFSPFTAAHGNGAAKTL
jgi:hypothetical protein